jgi:RHS repeat-associated protein
MTEIDFGGGMTFPLRMSFLSSRDEETGRDFGPGHWRTPLHDSRLMTKRDGRWPLLLPCGKVMSLFPKDGEKSVWATADEEWIARPKGANTLVTREDGWELEFSAKGYLIRLKADNGRTLLWTRDADGSLRSVAEFAGGKLVAPAYAVTRDPATRRVKSLRVTTRIGAKEWRYGYDASGRLTSLAFPDTSVVNNTYGSREDGHPWISITGRDAIATTLTWHKDNGSLLHDGVWSYDIQPQPDNNPIMRRTGPHGELEIQHDDAVNHRTLFTAAEGTQTIKQRVKTGPAKGKLESITRIVQKAEVGTSEVKGQKPETLNLKPETQLLYSATYDSRGLLETETDALGHKTTHTYTLHGSSIHTGIKTHRKTDALGHSSSEEYDAKGNLISQTNALGHTFRQEYDDQNRLTKTVGPDGTVIESLTYTASGRIQTRTDALGATTTYAYDREGNRISVTDALGGVTQFEYDIRGNRTATTDALGHTTRYEYDAGGRLTATILPEVSQPETLNLKPEPNEVRQTASGSPQGSEAHQTKAPSPTPQAPGSATRNTYDFAGRKLTTTAPDGTITEANTYDALDRLTSRTNALGHTTKFEYDVKRGSTGCLSCSLSGLPTRIISPTGRITERSYDADRHLLSETIAANTPSAATTAHVYDLAGNLISTTDPLGRITTFQYDSAGNRTKITYPDKTEKTFAYNALGQMTAETNELGHTTKKEYDPYGNLIAVTTPEGHTTRTLFGSGDDSSPKPKADDSSALQKHALRPGSAARRLPHAIVSPSGVTTAFYYDLLGRKITVTKAPGTPEAATTTHQFDAVGNEIATLSPVGIKTTHTYDSRRRRISTTDAIGRTWTFTYTDTAGPSGAPPCCGADPTSNSRAATTIHPDGTRDEKIYNALGQLIETRDANVTTTNDKLRTENRELRTGIRYAYDQDGRLTTLTDARGSVTKWRYDALGKLAAKTYPDNTVEAYEHDAAGQLVSRLRPNGVTATHAYDPRGRLLSIRWSDGKTEPSTFAYDAAGNMILAENHSAKITRTHTPGGRLQKETQEIRPSTLFSDPNQKSEIQNQKFEVGYQYNADGKLSQLLYPDSSTVSYHYNSRGDLSEVEDSDPTNHKSKIVNHKYSYTRRPDSKITSLSLPNGTTTHRTYDSVGRLSEIKHLDATGAVMFSETSRYDDRNRRTARAHADGNTDLFAYDPAGQVTAAAYAQAGRGDDSSPKQPGKGDASSPLQTTGAAANPTENREPRTANQPLSFTPSETFAYDPAGNRTQTTDGDTTTAYTTNSANQYTSISTGAQATEPQFDPLGNLLYEDQNTYTWDSDIHLLSVSTQLPNQPGTKNREQRTDFRYDALHRRVSRHESASNSTTLFALDRWNVISELSSSPSLPRSKSPSIRLVWGEDIGGSLQGAGGIGGLLSTSNQEQGITTPNFFHFDSNGNVVRLSDAKGSQSVQYAYNAFGQTIFADGVSNQLNRYQFSTKPIDICSGLTYYGFRYYSPKIGRWLCRDPMLELGGVNMYSTVYNQLVTNSDLLGLLLNNDQQSQIMGTTGINMDAYNQAFNNPGNVSGWSGSPCGSTCTHLSSILGSAMGGINGGIHSGGVGSSVMFPSALNQPTIDSLTQQIASTSGECCDYEEGAGYSRVSRVEAWTLSGQSLEECMNGDTIDAWLENTTDAAVEATIGDAVMLGIGATPGGRAWFWGTAALMGALETLNFNPTRDASISERESKCRQLVCPSNTTSMR